MKATSTAASKTIIPATGYTYNLTQKYIKKKASFFLCLKLCLLYEIAPQIFAGVHTLLAYSCQVCVRLGVRVCVCLGECDEWSKDICWPFLSVFFILADQPWDHNGLITWSKRSPSAMLGKKFIWEILFKRTPFFFECNLWIISRLLIPKNEIKATPL